MIPKEQKPDYSFQQNKIIQLNNFFMKSILRGSLLMILIFILSISILLLIISTTSIDETLKISIISMIATFVLTMSKSIIDRFTTVLNYLIRLLSEEQRGISKNIGIDIDEVDFDEIEKNIEEKD